MTTFFQWIDSHPAIYPLLAGGAWVLMLSRLGQLARLPAGEAKRWGQGIDWCSGVVIFLALLAWRWPYLLDPNPFNPDEAQMIVGAITIEHKPDFWRSFDGTTSGPLNAMVLLPMHWLGVPLDYFNARLTGVLLMWIAWAASFALLRRWSGPVVAYTALLPVVVYLGATVEGDILHYNSEHLSVALSCVGAWLLGVAGSRQFRGWTWWMAGIVLGLMPWAKLQAGPLAAMLSVWACGWVMLESARPLPERLRRCAALTVAVLLPSMIMVGLNLVTGQGADLWASYILNNLEYARESKGWGAVRMLADQAMETKGIPVLLLIQLVMVGWGGVAAWRQGGRMTLGFTLGALATIAAVVMVISPGRGFLHYLMFLFFPLAWWSGAGLTGLGFQGDGKLNRTRAWVLLAMVIVGLQLGVRLQQPLPAMLGRFEQSWVRPRGELAEVLRLLRRPGDTLAVWGWSPDLHVRTGLPQATRESHTYRQIEMSSMRDTYYRPRYLAEFTSDRPAFFVDTVGPQGQNFLWRSGTTHEAFPELAELVATDYHKLADFHPQRLYVRKDRLPEASSIKSAFERAAAKWIDEPANGDQEPAISLITGRPLRMIDGRQVGMMEPPAKIEWLLAGTERLMIFSFGHDPKSYAESGQGNGTLFQVWVEPPRGEAQLLWSRQLSPSTRVEDQGLQRATVPIPVVAPGSRLVIQTDAGPHGDNAWDWAYVVEMELRHRPEIFWSK